MLRRGIGPITGIHGTSIESVIMVDNVDVFESVRKVSEGGAQEFSGLTGFKVLVGGKFLGKNALALVPPYPSAVYEAVQELIVYGARKIIALARGYSLKKSMPVGSLVLPQAAVAGDSISSKIVPTGMPLLSSRSLYAKLGEEIIRKGQGGFEGYYRGKIVLTVDSVRVAAEYGREFLDEVSHFRDVVAVDTVTAPLYALQYMYPSLEASSLVYIIGDVDYALRVVMEDIEQYRTQLHKTRRLLSILALGIAEILRSPSEAGV